MPVRSDKTTMNKALSAKNCSLHADLQSMLNKEGSIRNKRHNEVALRFPSPPLDNIRVTVIVWSLRGNIIPELGYFAGD